MHTPESRWVRLTGRWAQWAGVGFCLVWAYAVGLFPVFKGQSSGYVPVVAGLLGGAVLSRRRARAALGDLLMRMSPGRFLGLAVAAALAVRLLALLLLYTAPGSDPASYHARALDLAAGRGYGHSAYWPPGVPLMLAAWYRLTVAHYLAGYILGVLLSALSVLVGYDVARRALTPLAARWTVVLLAVLPTLAFTCANTDAAAVLVLLVLVMADLALLCARPGLRGVLSGAALGAILGFACLVKPIFLLMPLVLLPAWLALGPPRRALRSAILCLALMACVVVPWTLRNYRALGAFVPVSTNGGINLYMGTNQASNGMYSRDCDVLAAGLFRPDGGRQSDPNARVSASGPARPTLEAIRLPGEVDELSSDRLRRQAALRRIADHPLQFARLAAVKQVYMWGTSSTNIAEEMNAAVPLSLQGPLRAAVKAIVNAFWAMLLVVVAGGTLRTDAWRNPKLWALLAFLGYLFVLHIFFEVQSRYHIPAVGALVLVAAAFLAQTDETPPQRARAEAGADAATETGADVGPGGGATA